MPDTYFISDSHFSHENMITKFKDKDGNPARDFKSVEEMDETMVANWNKRVGPEDKIYHLGDIAFSNPNLQILHRLNGRKILIKGNHDMLGLNRYREHFEDVRAYKVHKEKTGLTVIFSHIPIHPDCMTRFHMNVHGHLHLNHILKPNGEFDNRYFNISVEQINYTPITLEEISHKARRRMQRL